MDELVEPDWRRLPGFRDVSRAEWGSARWQRRHSVRTVPQLRAVFGRFLSDELAESIGDDQRGPATMPLLVPPQMLNVMGEQRLEDDPVRRYLLPAQCDRDPEWPSHPRARRDSLGESEMWAVEGLVHRYPSKVLVELLATCPQYCGHCTRMDLVGRDTPQFAKYVFATPRRARWERMLAYVRATPSVRDVVVSGGDLAGLPPELLEEFVSALLEVPHVRDVRLASKSLVALPQLFLEAELPATLERLGAKARERGVEVSVHTHANHAAQLTPRVAEAAARLREAGFAVRNQGVLLHGVNADAESLLALCVALHEQARITPYYLYLCDLVPNAEHWRTPLWQAQELQLALMGKLPGYATPRLVCDVPYLGKLWVHQADEYDRERGISYWSKRYATTLERNDADALLRRYAWYDPMWSLPESGRQWWREQTPIAVPA